MDVYIVGVSRTNLDKNDDILELEVFNSEQKAIQYANSVKTRLTDEVFWVKRPVQ